MFLLICTGNDIGTGIYVDVMAQPSSTSRLPVLFVGAKFEIQFADNGRASGVVTKRTGKTVECTSNNKTFTMTETGQPFGKYQSAVTGFRVN